MSFITEKWTVLTPEVEGSVPVFCGLGGGC